MIKHILRAATVATVALFAAIACVQAPAQAEQAKNELKLSRSVTKPMVAAKKLIDAKDWAGAIAKLKEIQAMDDKNAYDTYLCNIFLGVASFQAGDKKGATDAFIAAANVQDLPEEKHQDAVKKAMMMIIDSHDYARLVEFAQKNMPDDKLDAANASYLAIAYYNLKDDPNTQKYAEKTIALSNAEGKTPDRDMYQLILSAEGHEKNLKAQIKTIEVMCGLYGTPEDWERLIDISVGTLPSTNKKSRNVTAFYLYRLRLVVKAKTETSDYQLAAELAKDMRSYGDEIAALTAAQAAGKSNAKLDKMLAKARSEAKSDKATLATAEKAADRSKSDKMALSVAEAYFGYQRYADAERVAAVAVSKNGKGKNQALLLQGAAQIMQGKTDEGVATLAKVQGDAAFERGAQIWTIYAKRTYDKPKAEPAPADAQAAPADKK